MPRHLMTQAHTNPKWSFILNLNNPMNYCDETMSAEAASIGANIYALSAVGFDSQEPKIGTLYYALYDFAAEHAEARKIFRFID